MTDYTFEAFKSMLPWDEYVEHYDGDEHVALNRLVVLARMDMERPMPDEMNTIDVSSSIDDAQLSEWHDLVEGSEPYQFVVGQRVEEGMGR